ncbi:penicillin acylase family protein [Paracoccus sp. Z330]|uniref:Penicillin acylase family protein n=1 Tax=Paracoccus onchidii TaxID=3017813 RepID=A0ABT4ZEN3_9RHOB|nr:penicillin acylase family protein [Paracoccus onchidii]MDB6177819.1 penicillin acylase family protein [Paracoccus onchidii]
MLTIFRWLLRLTIALILLLLLGAVLTWYFSIRSLPDYDATYRMDGLSAPVEIVRSTENVPHIFGQSDKDMFFALGVAHAQDRLFQMTLLRRAAQGRLSEIQGPGAFASDDLARRLGLYRNARASLDVQDDDTRAALDAYAAGVNQWIAEVNENALGRGAPEFFLFPHQISYWQPTDSLAILKLIAASATNAVADEVLRARLSLVSPQYGPDLLDAAATSSEKPVYASLFPGARFATPAKTSPSSNGTVLSTFLKPGQGLGANGFAASPERTAAGGALLANDIITPLTAPSLFYLARLQLSSGGVIGATIPGIPAVLSGRNPHLAWGIAPTPVDDADIAIEEIQPGNPDRYRGRNGWTDFATQNEVIRILDGQPQAIILRETENGPVIPGLDPGLRDVTPMGHVPVLRWTGLSADDSTMSALIGLMRAPDTDSARNALRDVVAPAISVSLADSDGIRQIQAGRIPRRAANHPTAGRMPAPGWLEAANWQPPGDTDGDLIDKTGGILIATEEQQPDSLRQGRLTRLIQDREVHSRDSFIATQLDIISPAARALLPLVGANLWFNGDPAAPGTIERQRQDALSLLAEWDGSMSEHLPEPLIYAAWMKRLQDRLIRDDLGPIADDIRSLHPSFIDAVFRNRNGAARWCDIVQSAPQEDCTTIARQALDLAILDLSEDFGPQVTSWRWGDLHQAVHTHPGLGSLAGLGWIVNLTQSISGGDFTMAQSGLLGGQKHPYGARTGAGFRGVYDLADPDSSVFITSTGQSGHPLSRHYDDLAGLWRRGEYIGMSLDPDLARAAALGITELRPRDD